MTENLKPLLNGQQFGRTEGFETHEQKLGANETVAANSV